MMETKTEIHTLEKHKLKRTLQLASIHDDMGVIMHMAWTVL